MSERLEQFSLVLPNASLKDAYTFLRFNLADLDGGAARNRATLIQPLSLHPLDAPIPLTSSNGEEHLAVPQVSPLQVKECASCSKNS